MTNRAPYLAVIGIKHHQISSIIGIYPHEREQEQPLFVDIEATADISACLNSNHIADTVDYTKLADLATQLVHVKKYLLLEVFAWELAETILQKFPQVVEVAVWIKKPFALPSGEHAFVAYRQKRGESQ